MHIRKIACKVCSSRRVDQTKLSRLILLPYCTRSHPWIQYIDDSHLKQMSGYRQARKLLLGASQPRRGKTTTNGTYSWQFRCINSIHIVLCMSNGLIYVYVVGIHVKELLHHASRDICCNQLKYSDYHLVY